MVTLKSGNIFNTKADTIVNTINCVGVMGAGIAYSLDCAILKCSRDMSSFAVKATQIK